MLPTKDLSCRKDPGVSLVVAGVAVRHAGAVEQGMSGWSARALYTACVLFVALTVMSAAAFAGHSAEHDLADVASQAPPESNTEANTLDEAATPTSTGHEDHPAGDSHHHHGEQTQAVLPVLSMIRTDPQVSEDLAPGFSGGVRAAGGRERPD